MIAIKRSVALAGLVAFATACGGGESSQVQGGGETAVESQTGAAPAAPAAAAPATPAASGTVHEVKMLTTQGGASGVFEPATITVKKGDVIRFVSQGQAAHNVEFPAAENAGAANLPAPSPYLTDGQSFELPVTMDPGTYNYVCTPHAMMGMKGSITVQ